MDNPKKAAYVAEPPAFAAIVLDLKALGAGLPVEDCVSIQTGPQEQGPGASALADEALEDGER